MRVEDGIAIGVGIAVGITLVKGFFDLIDEIQKQQRIQQQMNLQLHYRLQMVESQSAQHNQKPHPPIEDFVKAIAPLQLQATKGYAPKWTDPDTPLNGNGQFPS